MKHTMNTDAFGMCTEGSWVHWKTREGKYT